MKKNIIFLILALLALSMSSCSNFLDQSPDTILTNDQIFNDPVMIKSVLANFYGRISWGQNIGSSMLSDFIRLDEAGRCDGGPDNSSTFADDLWRVHNYTLIRNINQFLQGLHNTIVLNDEDKKPLEGEARFIRAWTYFNTCRGLGGMPIVNDEIFDYSPGMDITTLQIPRSTEVQMYDYIINECKSIADMLSPNAQTHNARANKWTAKMLEARAALYAASLANYNNKMDNPITTPGGEVGIPADKAEAYYKIALAAAEDVINNSPYKLQDKRPDNKGLNFYEAVCVKDNNTEVIWARDYKYPGETHWFTVYNVPKSHAEDWRSSWLGPILNLVEDYEEIDTDNPGRGSKIQTKENGEYKFYESSDAPFSNRDPRLWATVIYPGAAFKGIPVILQAGQYKKENGEWSFVKGNPGSYDTQGNLITSVNGPVPSNAQFINKTGFFIRKFLDETPMASSQGRGSEMWLPRFRISEAYMIAAEASFELNNGKAANYINAVRKRAGVKPLQNVTFDNIVHECRVEFAFEDHRYWDMKRWRLADKVWNGNNDDSLAHHRSLWPYLVIAPGDPNDGKWIFVENYLFMSPHARYFRMRNYYNFLALNWLNNNPKLVKNPYQ